MENEELVVNKNYKEAIDFFGVNPASLHERMQAVLGEDVNTVSFDVLTTLLDSEEFLTNEKYFFCWVLGEHN